ELRIWVHITLPKYHVSILFHCITSLILIKILLRFRVPGSWFTAAIFALHPVQVESVAWISELKNTLSGVFFLSSALIYFDFDETRKPKAYIASLVLFFLGLV